MTKNKVERAAAPKKLEREELEKYAVLSSQLRELETNEVRTRIWLDVVRPELKAFEARIQEKYGLDAKKKWRINGDGSIHEME